MKNLSKTFLALVFALLISVPAYSETGLLTISINTNRVQEEIHVLMNHFGNYYSGRAVNVDLEFYSDNIEIYIEMFIPNGNNRLVAGTYNISSAASNNHGSFTFSYIGIGLYDAGYFEATGGTITVQSYGADEDLDYNIIFDLTIEDEDGLAGTMTGNFRGTFNWEDHSQ